MPTALELTREEWKRYMVSAPRRAEPRELTPEEQQVRDQLLARARTAAAMLKARFAARRVLLFGSLAHTAWFVTDSDVDMAVEGLASRDYWEAWRMVEGIIRDRPVDLVEIETVRESLQQAIERYGVEL